MLDETLETLRYIVGALTENLKANWNNPSTLKWIRLIAIVGAYILFRPYVLKLSGKSQKDQFEKQGEEAQTQAAIAANEIRNPTLAKKQKMLKEAREQMEGIEEGTGSGSGTGDWGSKARLRQRGVLKDMLEREEKRLEEVQGDDDDEDIKEFLEK